MTQVNGILNAVDFKEGQHVRKGQIIAGSIRARSRRSSRWRRAR
jgi:multidrug efflux pump subunit AcrA (membrane-fusion protein)